MLLGYRFSTGNSIVKRALKAMTVVVCVSYTQVTGNANRIPGHSLCSVRVAPTSHSENRERFREEKEALQI